MIVLPLLLALSTAVQPPEPRLKLTGVGRFAVFADLASTSREGATARMRSLQVAETDFHVGDQAYWGGWSWWAFDCEVRTADRLDFASLKADGAEGPATPETAPAFPAAPGGDAAELLAVACADTPGSADVGSVMEAVNLGRVALADQDVAAASGSSKKPANSRRASISPSIFSAPDATISAGSTAP